MQKDYADVDWDNVPDLESAPDVFEIHGMQHRRFHFLADDRDLKHEVGFSIGIEFPSYEEAAAHLEKIKSDSAFCEERLRAKHDHMHEYLGPVIWKMVTIRTMKPSELVGLNVMKDMRADVLAKKITFPVYLP